MPKTLTRDRLITDLDHVRLTNLRDAGLPPELAESLDTLDVVPAREVPADVVTMYSQVLIEEARGHRRQKLTLCYPHEAEPHNGFISVCSPVGAGLLGQRVGDTARWRTPNGEVCEAEVVELLFQPEASGDYTT